MKNFALAFTRKATLNTIIAVVLIGLGHCAFASYGVPVPPLFYLTYIPTIAWVIMVFVLIKKTEHWPEKESYVNMFLSRWFRVVENIIRLIFIVVFGLFIRGQDQLIIGFIIALCLISIWYGYCWVEVQKNR